MKYVPDSYIERNDMADEPGPPDPDDLCMVCNKIECECPPEDLGTETPPFIDQTPNETDNFSSGSQLRKREGGFVAPAGGPNEMSAAIAILRRGDCDSNGPATLQTLNPHTARKPLPVLKDDNDSSDSRQQKEELGASDEHIKRMITFGEMWHRKKLTPKELADAIIKAKQDHPEDFPK